MSIGHYEKAEPNGFLRAFSLLNLFISISFQSSAIGI
jgi:hypothetical protein